LLEDGYRVICVDSLETGSLQNVEHLRGDAFSFVNHDITAPLEIEEPIDVVYHLASPASPIDYLRLPLLTLKVGSHGTHNALGLAKWKRARFLLASTSEVYGDPLIHPQPETYWGNVNPIGPRGVYDEAKRFGEALTMAYRRTAGVNTGIVRIFNTFGPRMRPFDGRAIPTFIRQALAGEPITVAGDGSQTRSVCFVDDLVEGIVRFAHTDHSGPVNIGNPHEISVLALAELIRDLCDSRSQIQFVERPQDDPSVRQPDITLARDLLGWGPKVEMVDGLRRTIDWFASHPELTAAEPARVQSPAS
jgi:dTDP-glucose 4,6-dehydratase